MATTTSFSTQNIRQRNIRDHVNLKVVSFIVLIALPAIDNSVKAQESIPVLHFNVSIPQSTTDAYHVEFYINGLDQDTLNLKMPKWMPGYYQIMNYTENIYNISSQDPEGHSIPIKRQFVAK